VTRPGTRPFTRTRKPEPDPCSTDWVVWAAWADRVSFDEIHERTGLNEAAVISLMRRELQPSSFRRWRARVSGRGTKHRRRFEGTQATRQDRRHRNRWAGYSEP
jgi:uncharacterized protein (TIGR03643 family)